MNYFDEAGEGPGLLRPRAVPPSRGETSTWIAGTTGARSSTTAGDNSFAFGALRGAGFGAGFLAFAARLALLIRSILSPWRMNHQPSIRGTGTSAWLGLALTALASAPMTLGAEKAAMNPTSRIAIIVIAKRGERRERARERMRCIILFLI